MAENFKEDDWTHSDTAHITDYFRDITFNIILLSTSRLLLRAYRGPSMRATCICLNCLSSRHCHYFAYLCLQYIFISN